ncbi:MAG: hypothetical protein P8X43_11845 [Maritimibacter sp.]
MAFIRAEAAETLKRWREPLVAAAVVALGLWWGLTSLGVIKWIGWVLAAGSAGLLYAAIQRARFHGGHGGLGVVEVDERQIAYLAPVGGGILSLDALSEINIGPDRAGLPVWHLRAGMELLSIPASATGTEALFDVLTALPGANIEAAIRASKIPPHDKQVIWARRPAALH